MDYTQIEVRREGAVTVITLNRPERLNAWTPHMAEEQVGAIVMTGAGRGFCAGADMEATFKTRIDGQDPGNDTAGGAAACRRASTGSSCSARASRSSARSTARASASG